MSAHAQREKTKMMRTMKCDYDAISEDTLYWCWGRFEVVTFSQAAE